MSVTSAAKGAAPVSKRTQPALVKRSEHGPRVLVSVLNYRGADDSVETIRSLQRQDVSNMHLQVLDNASPDDSVMRIKAQVPGIEIRVTEENLGYCGGNNRVLRQALAEDFDYVIVCNHDIQVAPNAIRLMVETAESHHDSGVVGAVEFCALQDRVTAASGAAFSLWTGRSVWSRHVPGDGTLLSANYVQGALVLFTRRALEGGLRMNEDLFMYGDEVDLGYQLAKADLKAYVDTRVVVRHKNREKFYNARAGYLHQRNRVYLVHRYGKWYHRVGFHLGVALVELPSKILVRSLQGRSRFAWACVLGYVDGVIGRMGAGRATAL
jgi:GT2 family glycosyltransferase